MCVCERARVRACVRVRVCARACVCVCREYYGQVLGRPVTEAVIARAKQAAPRDRS